MAKKKKPEVPANAYVVRGEIDESYYSEEEVPKPSEQYCSVFTTEVEALAEAEKLNQADWLVNGTNRGLFCQGVEGFSTMPEPVFRDWLEDVGIELPANSEHASWQSWWSRMRGTDRPINREQFLHILEAMNRVDIWFYEVVPIDSQKLPKKLPKVGYAIVMQKWQNGGDDCYYGANYPAMLCMSQQKAQELCDQWNLNDGEIKHPPADLSELEDETGEPLPGYNEDDYWWGGLYEYVVVELPINPEA